MDEVNNKVYPHQDISKTLKVRAIKQAPTRPRSIPTPSTRLPQTANPVYSSGRRTPRWYLMSYTYGRKGLTLGLEQEIARRKRDGESPFEYFAPSYIESKEVDGKLVNSKTSLLYNYFFIHASEDEIFKLKKHQPQYNLLRKITKSDGSYYYPYVSDAIIRTLQWIANSYEGYIPLYLLDQTLLIKGDRIRITKGRFKGVEARLVSRPKSSLKEIMVFVDNWMCVPLMNVKPTQYEVIDLNNSKEPVKNRYGLDNPGLSKNLHEALCRFHTGDTTEADIKLATDTFNRYATVVVETSILRCKLYSMLLPACTILGNKEKLDGLLKLIHVVLPTIKAEQSLALLLLTLYGCTNNSLYYDRAHSLLDPLKGEAKLKKSRQHLLERLADYDRCFNH